jgi:hypothetical protein
MIVLGIDPGPTHCGLCVYDLEARKVLESHKACPADKALDTIDTYAGRAGLVAIERVQSYGIAGSSLLRTSETVGRLWQCAKSLSVPAILLYRRQVLQGLDVTGKGNRDALVRERLIEMHGGDRKAAQGTKKSPGPLYGVSSHAWSALAVAITAAEIRHD